MRTENLTRLRRTKLLHRFHTRFLLLAAVATIAVGVGAGIALAKTRTTAIGTGVVVIDTNLGYESGEAAGTGMVLSSSGEILTNNHVIRGATSIKIVVPGTGHTYTATVVGYDATEDVAVIQAAGASNLKTISLGNSSKLKVGQAVTATGNAGGTGKLTTTSGKITGLAKAIAVSDDSGGTENLAGLIEMNSEIQPGDSGGPLRNAAGQVIGMNTAASVVYTRFQQTASTDGYAIPINSAVRIASQIEAGTASAKVHIGTTAFLGIEVAPNGFGGSGALVEGVVTGGAAANAGLVAGDVITAVDGQTVSSPTTLSTILLGEQAGAQVSVVYADTSGATQTATVTLGSGPPQ